MKKAKKVLISAISLIAFLFFRPGEVVYHFWLKSVLGCGVSRAADGLRQAYAGVLATVEEALAAFFGSAEDVVEEVKALTAEQQASVEEQADVHLNPFLDREFRFYIGRTADGTTGYAVPDVVAGKWGPIHYMLLLAQDGTVLDAMILQYEERRGRPVAKRRFLKQFIGKGAGDEIRLRRDIRGVTGASISSRGMADGIRKMVHVFKEFYGRN